MVAWRGAVLAAAVLSASCTSIFDSYYPDSVEYLETQTDLLQVVGGQPIVTVHMQVLQANTGYSDDVLAMIVDTDDGKQTVVFYGTDLKKIRSYSQSTLTSANLGVIPDLYPMMEDGSGFYTGQVAYLFSGGKFQTASKTAYTGTDLISGLLTAAQPLSQLQPAHYDDAVNHFPILFNNTSAYYNSVDDVGSITSVTPFSYPGAVTFTSPRLLGATCWNQITYAVVADGGKVYLVKSATNLADPANFTAGSLAVAKPKDGGTDTSLGWATARGAVVSSHSDNASLLRAFDWSGNDKGSIRVASKSNDVAYAFHPNGQYWFVYDPVNSRVTKYKAWW